MSPNQKGAGGKLKRSEIVTVRLDPKLRYGVELAARKHRRTASSFIEWAVERALDQMVIREQPDNQWEETMQDVLKKVWDVDEPDRLAKLAIQFPELLSHEEQVLWKLIREYGLLWKGRWLQQGEEEEWTWEVSEQQLVFNRLREHWDTLKAITEGSKDISALPDYTRKRPIPPSDIDDLPF